MRSLITVFLVLTGWSLAQERSLTMISLSGDKESIGLTMFADVASFGVIGVGYSIPIKDYSEIVQLSGNKTVKNSWHFSKGEVMGGFRVWKFGLVFGFNIAQRSSETFTSGWVSDEVKMRGAAGLIFRYDAMVIGVSMSEEVRWYLGVGF